MTFLYVTLVCLFILEVHGLEVHRKCEEQPVEVVKPFNVSEYLGVWYEYAKYDVIFERNMDCIVVNYSRTKYPNEFRAQYNHTILSTNQTGGAEGILYFVDPSQNEAKMINKFRNSPGNNYWVIGTDYVNYSVVWCCMDIGHGTSLQFLWILSRTTELSPENLAKVDTILKKAKLAESPLRKTVLDKCHWNQ